MKRTLSATKAAGGTHFSKAFEAIQKTLEKIVPPLRKQHGTNMAIVVAFMTDGEDSEGCNFNSVRHYEVALSSLKNFLRTSDVTRDIPSMFHALAFGASHDFPFLDSLRANAGTIPGGFQYAEPSDGTAALTTKLDAIVNSVANPAVQTRLRVQIPGFLVNVGSCLEEVWEDGSKSSLQQQLTYPAGTKKIILNMIVKRDGHAEAKQSQNDNSASSSSSSSSSATPSHTTESAAANDTTITTTTESRVTPVNTSVGITYVTDYYGQVMPSFPQPGLSQSASLYSYDPYSVASSFGPQPGMSHTFDFGPQPGSSHVAIEYPSSHVTIEHISTATPSSEVPISSATSSSQPRDSAATKDAADTTAESAEIGAQFLVAHVFQVRQDELSAGELPCDLKIRVDHLHSDQDRLLLMVEKMKVALEALELEITQAILHNSASNSWSKYAALINKYERKLNNSATFLISVGKSKRAALAGKTIGIRDIFTKLHALLAQATKGDMSTSQLAKMAEVAHGQQFSKARHGRTMDSRTSKNAGEIEKEQNTLRFMNIDSDSVTSAVYDVHQSEEAEKLLHEWFCVLTQDNWMNLLVEEKDCVGFGIALRRPEFVLDDPTQLRILDISLTCVSKSAFEHILTHKLIQAAKDASDPIQAKLAYLGGFNVEGKDLGVVVRGAANEPINAWLPLYIHEQHWKVAFAQFKSSTGYLVTLNPLGYAYNQIDVYFMILATMIVRMKVASNRQVEVTIQYLRTCAAIMRDCNGYMERMKSVVRDFLNKTESRLKDVTPNLLVVMGFLAVLPLKELNELIPSDQQWVQLWLAFFTEITRRALDSCSRTAQLGNEASVLFTNLISRLVDGYLNEAELTAEELTKEFNPEEAGEAPPPPLPKTQRTFKSFSAGPSATDAELDAKKRLMNTPVMKLDLKKEGETTSVWAAFWEAAEQELKEERHHMEWASLRATDDYRVMPARAESSNVNSSTAQDSSSGRSIVDEAVAEAVFHVPTDRYSNMSVFFGALYTEQSATATGSATDKKSSAIAGRESLVDANEIKNRPFSESAVLPTSLAAVHLCENVVANFGQPTVEGLINIMTFIKSWSNLQLIYGGTANAIADLDRNLGVAPVSWLVHFRDDWQRRPHLRNSFFTFLNFLDVSQLPSFSSQIAESGLRAEVLQLRMLRALLAQNAKFATNKDARLAMDSAKDTKSAPHSMWKDPVLASDQILIAYHKERVQRLISVASAVASAHVTLEKIQRMLATSDIYEFIGSLRSWFGASRSTTSWGQLIKAFHTTTAPTRPLAVVKLSIIFTGKFLDPNSGVIIRVLPGPEYVPGRARLSAFHSSWGHAFKAVTDMNNLTYVRARTLPNVNLDE